MANGKWQMASGRWRVAKRYWSFGVPFFDVARRCSSGTNFLPRIKHGMNTDAKFALQDCPRNSRRVGDRRSERLEFCPFWHLSLGLPLSFEL
jgi:hypothetical protein